MYIYIYTHVYIYIYIHIYIYIYIYICTITYICILTELCLSNVCIGEYEGTGYAYTSVAFTTPQMSQPTFRDSGIALSTEVVIFSDPMVDILSEIGKQSGAAARSVRACKHTCSLSHEFRHTTWATIIHMLMIIILMIIIIIILTILLLLLL